MSNTIYHKLTVKGANPDAVIDAVTSLFATVNQESERTQDGVTYDCGRFFPNKQIAEVSRQFPENTIVVDSFDDGARVASRDRNREGLRETLPLLVKEWIGAPGYSLWVSNSTRETSTVTTASRRRKSQRR